MTYVDSYSAQYILGGVSISNKKPGAQEESKDWGWGYRIPGAVLIFEKGT
jgi:hypothetical protein